MTKIQVYPTAARVELNDKDTEILFNLNPEYFAKMIEEGTAKAIIEKRKGKGKKQKEVVSLLLLENANGITPINVLDEFDRAVLAVCVSEYDAGNRYLTIPIIYRGLTGKIGKANKGVKPSRQQIIDIRQSIDKLLFTAYDPKVIEALKSLKYDVTENDAAGIIKAPILPCERVSVTIGGKELEEVVQLTKKPALFVVANIKNQILRYPAELLDVPKQNNSRLNIALKNYVMRRIVEIIKHNMTRTLTLKDIFKKCRIAKNAHSQVKQRARECISALFEHLKGKGMIEGLGQILEFEWHKKGNEFEKISFKYESAKKEGKKPKKWRQ